MVFKLEKLVESGYFKYFILGTIVLGGALVGVETYDEFALAHYEIISLLNKWVIVIFTAEIVLKILSKGNRPWAFFQDPWHIFDFVIVASCLVEPLLPFDATFLPVLRLTRILRVLKLISAVPDLQLLIGTLLRSFSSMFYLSLLLLLLFYIYGTMGVFMFQNNDPIHFQNLQTSMLSMFRVATLEDWTDIMYINMYGSENYGYEGKEDLIVNSTASPLVAAVFFTSFVILGTMVILNLVIGVIINSMDETKKEQEFQNRINNDDLDSDLETLKSNIEDLKHQIEMVQIKAKKQ